MAADSRSSRGPRAGVVSVYAGACTISLVNLVVGGHHVDRADRGGPSASQPLVRGEESEERLARTLLNFT